jgi:hypothetical protein
MIRGSLVTGRCVMAVSEADLELFAARIRLHFEPELRDAAYALALPLALACGARIKSLRPETSLAEIRGWMGLPNGSPGRALLRDEALSLFKEIRLATRANSQAPRGLHVGRAQQVLRQLVDTARGRVIVRELRLRPPQTTFREWVLSRARVRRRA